MDGKIRQFLAKTYAPVWDKAKKVNDGWNLLGMILENERTIHERSTLANPSGLNKKSAENQLARLEKELGPKTWKTLQETKEMF